MWRTPLARSVHTVRAFFTTGHKTGVGRSANTVRCSAYATSATCIILLTGAMENGRNTSLVRFGLFELKKDTGELRKNGVKIKLQGKPVQLLQALLERPGEVVSRDDLQKRLWPGDTVVDFESGLNTAANRLRLALGDSAEHPHYVETLSRIGYRFVAPILDASAPFTEALAAESPDVPQEASPSGTRKVLWMVLVAGVLVATAISGIVLRPKPAGPPAFHQVTFRRMTIGAARFGPDGQSVVYFGRERYGAGELYLTHPSSPESRPLGFQRVSLASISRAGELALLTFDPGPGSGRSLLRVPLNGGAPLTVDAGVYAADWTPDGSNMAVIRGGVLPSTLEFPRGKVVFQGSAWLSDVRVSPSGREVAFMDHPIRGDDGGSVKLLDGKGACSTLSDGWASAAGLAWAPSGREVWFTAARAGLNRSLMAVDVSGHLRSIAGFPGALQIYDISHTGRVLISRDEMRLAMNGVIGGEETERDLSWFDWTHATGISEDGQVILFDETGEGGGPHYSAYIRRADASSAVRIGEGNALAISPDGKWVITIPDRDRTHLTLVPLLPGVPRTISGGGLQYDWVRLFPDGTRVLAGGNLAGGKLSLFTQTLDGAKPQPLKSSTYLIMPAISPDGKQIAGLDAQRRLVILPVAGGDAKVIPLGFPPWPLRWGSSGKSILVQNANSVPAVVFRVDIGTGRYDVWKKLSPVDLSGVSSFHPAVISRDEKSYAYSFRRDLSELFIVDGWL
jgi:DNA-binding winged helix-turn-helix (wHTH) protein